MASSDQSTFFYTSALTSTWWPEGKCQVELLGAFSQCSLRTTRFMPACIWRLESGLTHTHQSKENQLCLLKINLLSWENRQESTCRKRTLLVSLHKSTYEYFSIDLKLVLTKNANADHVYCNDSQWEVRTCCNFSHAVHTPSQSWLPNLNPSNPSWSSSPL